MSTLEDTVRSVVQEMIKSEELFTALDVSNKVKLQLPFVRHREVRDVVRALFTSDIEPAGWARTPIQVKLPNGNPETAVLYHPLSASWNLDDKYDDQKREQAALRPGTNPVSTGVAAPVAVTVVQGGPIAPVVTPVVAPAPVPSPTARQQWANLFTSQPSLFPTK